MNGSNNCGHGTPTQDTAGPLADKWTNYKNKGQTRQPGQQAQAEIIVVGTGLAEPPLLLRWRNWAIRSKPSAFQDSPCGAHSIAAGEASTQPRTIRTTETCPSSLLRYRERRRLPFREANVHRLAEVSVNIIDQCVAQGCFAREYGGLLDNRSFGGAQVSRTFYARGQTGQQLLLKTYQAWRRQIGLGNVKQYSDAEMLLDLVVIDVAERGHHSTTSVTGELERHFAMRYCSAPVDTATCSSWSTNAMGSVTAAWKAIKGLISPIPATQIHPTCTPCIRAITRAS